MKLKLADGWSQVEPRETTFTFLADDQSPDQMLVARSTCFEHLKKIGYIGGTNCPIAVDDIGKKAYRAASRLKRVTKSFKPMHIKCFDLANETSTQFDIDEPYGVYWMLEYYPQTNSLLMLLSDFTRSREQHLGWLDLKSRELRLRPLPDETFHPEAVERNRKQIVFNGRWGRPILVTDDGKQVAELQKDPPAHVFGAAFSQTSGTIVLGRDGLWEWQTETDDLRRLTERGSYPVFNKDGTLWFNAADGALACFDAAAGTIKIVVELTGVEIEHTNYGQPIVFSPDGRYGLARLTGKERLAGAELERAEEQVRQLNREVHEFDRYRYFFYFCILDLLEKVVWQYPGYSHNVSWVSGRFYK